MNTGQANPVGVVVPASQLRHANSRLEGINATSTVFGNLPHNRNPCHAKTFRPNRLAASICLATALEMANLSRGSAISWSTVHAPFHLP